MFTKYQQSSDRTHPDSNFSGFIEKSLSYHIKKKRHILNHEYRPVTLYKISQKVHWWPTWILSCLPTPMIIHLLHVNIPLSSEWIFLPGKSKKRKLKWTSKQVPKATALKQLYNEESNVVIQDCKKIFQGKIKRKHFQQRKI